MQMVFLFSSSSELTIKSKIQHAEHIERGEHSRDHTNNIHGLVVRKYMGQYFVLREKPGERRYTGNSNSTDQHSYEGRFQFAFQTAHHTHILLITHGVNNRTRAEE